MHETRNNNLDWTREDYFYYLPQDPLGLNDEIYNVVISFALTFSPIRSMILDSFLMILVRYNFWTMRRFLLPLRLLLLDWKSELLEMIVLRRYIFTPSRLKLLVVFILLCYLEAKFEREYAFSNGYFGCNLAHILSLRQQIVGFFLVSKSLPVTSLLWW